MFGNHFHMWLPFYLSCILRPLLATLYMYMVLLHPQRHVRY